jgi:hypothetical protein
LILWIRVIDLSFLLLKENPKDRCVLESLQVYI